VVEALAGLAAIAGHCWSPYIRFTGGRGVATGIGGALALAPWSILIVLPIGLVILKATRYVSLASLVGSAGAGLLIAVGALLGYLPTAYALYGLLGAALIIGKHHDNIRRLLAGAERRLGERAPAPVRERSPATAAGRFEPDGRGRQP
jgi:glycerol-3-phosphate acyltransferase PlsY